MLFLNLDPWQNKGVVGLEVVAAVESHDPPQQGGQGCRGDDEPGVGHALPGQLVPDPVARDLPCTERPEEVSCCEDQPDGVEPVPRGTASLEDQGGQDAEQDGQREQGVDDEQDRPGPGRGVEGPENPGPVDREEIQKNRGFQDEDAQQEPPLPVPPRVRVQSGDHPGHERRKESQEGQGVTEPSMIDEIVYRSPEGDEGIQVRQRPQDRAPDEGLSADLRTEDGFAAGGAERELRQGVQRNVPRGKGNRA